MNLTFWEIAKAVSATNNWKQWQDFEITGVEFDSRIIGKGALFVPLKGLKDGHTFIYQAIEKGAKAAFWSTENQIAPADFPVLQVNDSLKAMQELAKYYLKKIRPTVIAITGSNGKTTTKDMTEAVVSQAFYTYKTQGNYNNEIGLPYTILHMPNQTEKLILEMGMDHAGDIALLSELAQPDIAAITMIGEAHIETLGSKENIAREKMDIAKSLKPNGLLLLPQEDTLTPFVREQSQSIQTFGLKEKADFQGMNISAAKEQTVFTVPGFQQPFTIPIPGDYNVTNALIAIGIGKWLQIPETKIRQGLAAFKLTANRTQWLMNNQQIEILSDVYNANPTAMRVVLKNFAKIPTDGKRVAVLGDMLELGSKSSAMHRSIKEVLHPQTISTVFLYGQKMAELFKALQSIYPQQQLHYFTLEQKNQLIQTLQQYLQPKDIVVLKASNGMGLKEVVQALMKEE